MRLSFTVCGRWWMSPAAAAAVETKMRNPSGRRIVFTDSTHRIGVYLFTFDCHISFFNILNTRCTLNARRELPFLCANGKIRCRWDCARFISLHLAFTLHYLFYTYFPSRVLFSFLVVRARDFLFFFLFCVWQNQFWVFVNFVVATLSLSAEFSHSYEALTLWTCVLNQHISQMLHWIVYEILRPLHMNAIELSTVIEHLADLTSAKQISPIRVEL